MKKRERERETTLTFQDFHIREENRTVPAWSHYRYHAAEKDDYMVFREYVLREEEARTLLMCPKVQTGSSTYEYKPGDAFWMRDVSLRA